jgi:hypothetical protein
MPRTFAAPLMLAAAVFPLLAAQAPQSPGTSATNKADGFLLLVTTQGKAALAGAHGTLFGEPEHVLVALRDLRGTADLPVLTGTSSDRGLLRFAATPEAAACHAGSGFVITDSGLGALFPRLLAGHPDRIELQPMAAVSTNNGSEPFQLFARAHLPGGEIVTLPPYQGREVRLPAGSYEVWARSADGWIWQRLALAPGQRSELHFEGPAQRVRPRAGTAIHPAGRGEVPLFGTDGEATLRGAALAAPLAGSFGAWRLPPQVVPGPPRTEPIVWPMVSEMPATQRMECAQPADTTQAEIRSAQVVLLQQTEGASWRILYQTRLQGDPERTWLDLPQAVSGDGWLLLLADGHAPKACPWSLRSRAGGLTLERGRPLLVQARDDGNRPVEDLAVEYVPDQMEPATVAARTDARGTARLGQALGPGVLRISDARFLNQDLPLVRIPEAGVALTVTSGAAVTGRTLWPDGTAAASVMVTLRDTNGTLRPSTRSVVTGADGTFTFPGLPETTLFVVFGSTWRDGHTWSGRFDRARAAGEQLELTVRDEDPRLGNDR